MVVGAEDAEGRVARFHAALELREAAVVDRAEGRDHRCCIAATNAE
jgi:hypothetical protein